MASFVTQAQVAHRSLLVTIPKGPFMPLMIAVLTLFAALMPVDADAETDAERLAEMFSPILILTEDTLNHYGEDMDRGTLILRPEPVEIMGAHSAESLRFWAVIANKKYDIDSYLNWVPPVENQLKLGDSTVDFSQNKFAFFTNGLYIGNPPSNAPFGQHIIRTYFDYPGTTPQEWNDEYTGSGARAGANFSNTAYVHMYQRNVTAYTDPVTVIQYFYFYPYNDWWNNHEGDWQRIDVVVSSSDPNTATILGLEYRFHKVWVTYYKDWGSNPGLTDSFVFNPRNSLKLSPGPTRNGLVQYTHPVVYVGAGSHAGYPVGGEIPLGLNAEHMTHTGLVLSTQADDAPNSNLNLWESYDLALLPDPDLADTNNMGLTPAMSWLGARIRWGTPSVGSPTGSEAFDGNESPKKGPYNSHPESGSISRGWGDLALSDVGRLLGIDAFHHSDLPYEAYHHWAILGDEVWSGTISLRGDVVVFPGATLTINAGTVIEFEPEKDRHKFSAPGSVSDLAEIFVYGALNAEGTSDSPIRFRRKSGTPAQAGYAWGGIRVMEGGEVNLDYTTIRNMPPPPSPTGLTAQAGTGQATLRWDAYPVDADITEWQYRLKPEGVGWKDWQTIPNSGTLTTEHTVTGLIGGETSTFLVRAVNSTGAGSASAALSVDIRPLSSSLVKPTHTPTLTARAGDGEVTLSWDEPNAIQCTWQYQQTTPGFLAQPSEWENIPDSRTFTTEYTVGDLTNGLTYVFKVRAVNDYGQGPESMAVSVMPTAGGHKVPEQPTGLSVQVPVTSPEQPVRRPGQLDVRWGAVSATPAVNGYTLRYQSKLDLGVAISPWSDWCILPDAIAAGTTSYTHTGLSGDTLYRYQVRATNAQGNGAWSAAFPEAGLEPNSPTEAPARRPSAPQNLMAAAANESVTLTWQAPANNGGATISDYKYRYCATESTRWSPSAEGVPLGQTTRRTVVGNLTNDTAYTFEVWANNAQGKGAVAQATATPRGPFTLNATARDTYVLLLWTAAPSRGKPIDRYAYRYSRDGGATWTSPSSVWIRRWQADEPLSYTATGLTNGVRYMFEVYAYDSVGAVAVASASATPGAATTDVQVSYSAEAYQAEEGGAAVAVAVRLTEAARQAVSIPVTVTRDADTEEGDYTVGGLTAGALSFAVGADARSFTILAHEDADMADETVELGLTLTGLPSWLGAGAPTTATVTLRDNDDDPAGRVSLSSSSPWVDSPLTATLLDDSGSIRSTTWQWQRRLHGSSWQPAPGTSSSLYHTVSIYRPTSSDRGYQLRVTARYDDADDTGQTAASDPTDAVQVAPTDPATTDPAGRVSLSSSSPWVDSPLTATLLDDSGSIRSTTWQWERRLHGSPWQPAGGTWSSLYHTVSIYRPASSDRGYQLRATARYDDADDIDQTAASDPTDAVQAAPPQRRPIFSQDRVSYSVQAGSTVPETLPSAEGADSYETSGTVPGYVEVNTTTRAMTIRPENTHVGDDEFIWRARNTHGTDDLTVNIMVTSLVETQSAYRISASGSTAPSFIADVSGIPSGWSLSRQTPISTAPYEWQISRTRLAGGSWSNWGSATVVSTYPSPPETQSAYRISASGSTAPSFIATASGIPTGWSSSRRTPISTAPYEWRIRRTRPSGGSWSNWGSATVIRTYEPPPETQSAYRISASGSTAPSFSTGASGIPSGWSSSRRTPISTAPYEWRIRRTRPSGGSWSNWGSATVIRTYEPPPETQSAYRISASGSTAPSFSAGASGIPTGWSSSRQTPISTAPYEWRIRRTRPSGGSWSNWGSATVIRTYEPPPETQSAYRISASGSTAPSFSAGASGIPSGWSSSRQTPISTAPYEWRIRRTRPSGGSWSNWGSATVVRTYTEGQSAYRRNNSSSPPPTFSATASGVPSGWSSSRRTPTSSNRYEWRISRSRPAGGSWSN